MKKKKKKNQSINKYVRRLVIIMAFDDGDDNIDKSGHYDGFLICFPMNYRDFSVKINGENNSEITIFIFTGCKKRRFYEFSAKSLAQKV